MNDTELSKDRFKPLTYEQMYGVEEPETDGRPLELDIDTLLPFPNQPFHPYKEDEMEKMVESIQENGIISPIIVRPKEDGTYEIISGHNRVEACRRAGIMQIPSFIREVDDDTAVILMVDSNLRQRDGLSDMEKAKAYELKMEAIKRQGARTDLTSCQVGTKFRADNAVAENTDDSPRQIQRYIRLNSLIPALQDAVEDKRIAFNPAVEISYLDPADQAIVQEIMEREETAPSLSQAQKLKKMAQDGSITDKRIDDVLTVEKPMYETITFRFNTIEKFFPAGTTGKQMEQKIYEWMERYRRQWQSREEKTQEQER
ncbi:MAG: ParB/RepB/Spo0J family partition protein [Clostridia bacterium]|nr:ParB/RepB/Spo0J family partition protein [Clostridia bacterium]